MELPRVIYEDKNFVAVSKPAGLLVHGTRAHSGSTVPSGSPSKDKRHIAKREFTLVDWLLKHYPEVRRVGDDPLTRPGIVHRLDRETSGVMLIARNQKYFEYLKSLFQKRDMKKVYLAVVWGRLEPKHGVIDAPIGIRSGTVKRSVHAKRMTKEAITEYRVLQYFDREAVSLVEVLPRTGRTHQIRVHLASIGHPVVGDILYGGKANRKWHIADSKEYRTYSTKREDENQKAIRHTPYAISSMPSRLMLHALSLEFTTAEGRRIKIEAEPPEEFAKFL